MLDGNAIAGLLQEIFGAEMTAAPRRCASCGTVSEVGAHRLYEGAGFVLRCPSCGDVALLAAERVVELRGTWRIQSSAS